jgi:hypothetical protein
VERWPPNRDVADLDQVVGDGDLVGDLLAVERLVAGLRPLLADDHELPGDLHVFDGVVVAGRVGETEVHVHLAVGVAQVLGLAGPVEVDAGGPPGVADQVHGLLGAAPPVKAPDARQGVDRLRHGSVFALFGFQSVLCILI